MADAAPITRQWLLLQTLSARRHGATVRELADDAGVRTKTVRRNLQALQAAGFALESEEQAHGRKVWRFSSAGRTLNFAPDEAAALYLGRQFLEPLAGTQLWGAAGRAFRKIKAGLGETALKHLSRLSDAFHATAAGASDYSRWGQLLDDLMMACEDRRFVLLAYQSLASTEPVTYELHPYGFVYHKFSLYLVAYSNDHGDTRVFKLDRMSEVQVQDLRFVRPPELTVARLLEHSFGVVRGEGIPVMVRARFAPTVARYVEEHRWHASQSLTRLPDGAVQIELQLTHTGEFKRWIYSFGSAAEVLAPPELREEMAEELRAMAGLYVGSEKSYVSNNARGR